MLVIMNLGYLTIILLTLAPTILTGYVSGPRFIVSFNIKVTWAFFVVLSVALAQHSNVATVTVPNSFAYKANRHNFNKVL